MKTQRNRLIAVALLASLGMAATAQTALPAPPAAAASQGHHGFDSARRQEHMAKRQAELKQKLQLTASQEPAWTSFTTAMKPASNAQRPDRAAIEKMSTPDRIDHLRSLRTTRIAEMDRRADATKAFYAQLSAEQKKTFDAETAHWGRGHHGHGQRGFK